MTHCSACSVKNDPTSKFCSECGAALKPEYEATLTQGNIVAANDSSVPSLPSASSHHGRFLPGTMVTNRYRIVSLVGKGGMGEVYRADDLKLGHSVALKFLPQELADDPQRLKHFVSEVRLTRQISHPNVCRMYDIGELEGQHFLSMEHIDGEDLKILLRRIGRLPKDKGVQIAQQLCAGLAAAHDRGVLHRDLKPANIMIDGQGQVRITDFGLARLADDGAEAEIAGTPAYMAPEQLARGQTTIQSDLYSLGLILFELFTGEAVHKSNSIPELLQQHQESAISQPSTLAKDMDPTVERVILRCLEKDAWQRPKTVREVAAALPGGDPLMAAMAAGETPSPQMIAAAGVTTAMPLRLALLALLALAVGLFVLCWLADGTYAVNRAGLQNPPAVLKAEARKFIEQDLGYSEAIEDSASGFVTNAHGRMQFWYRQRPGAFLHVSEYWSEGGQHNHARPSFGVPGWDVPGELGLKMSPDGKIRQFRRLPEVATTSRLTVPSEKLPWSTWFPQERTGFHLTSGRENSYPDSANPSLPVLEVVSDTLRTPQDAYDAVRVWKGVDPNTKQEFFVQAAAYQGRPVYFQYFSANQFLDRLPPDGNNQAVLARRARAYLYAGVIAAGIIFCIFNLLSGRGDRHGALRVALAVFFVKMAIWLMHAHHLADAGEELSSWALGFAQATQMAALLWIWYIAMEPFVRKIWPQVMISWQRLLEGRISDPLVGRDILLGTLFGVLCVICAQLSTAARLWQTGSLSSLRPVNAVSMTGPLELLGAILVPVTSGLSLGLFGLVIVVFFRAVLGTERRAIVAFVTLMITMNVVLNGADVPLSWLPLGIWAILVAFVLVHIGLLARIVQLVVISLLLTMPLTLNSSHWYFGQGMLAVGLLFCLALYGFYTSVGGRPYFARMLSEQ